MEHYLPMALASLSLFLAGGCHRMSILAGAIVCQGLSRPPESMPADGWSYWGLDARIEPRLRPGTYASATRGVHFIGADDLGPHGYWLTWAEHNGIAYTCRGGHIDTDHLRKATDWTGYLAAVTLEHLHKGRTAFQFKFREPSRCFVELTYPSDWDSRSAEEQVRIARDVSRCLGQYLAYTAMTWHEVLTWFGFRPTGYKSEFQSAFSWEDIYSNLLGTQVGVATLQDKDHPFSEAATLALRRKLDSLGVQPAAIAAQASEAVRGQWYSSWLSFTVIRKRNFDIGLDGGCVSPSIVRCPGVCDGAREHPLAVPTLGRLSRYGFSARVQIEPRVWEQNKIFRALYGARKPPTKRIDPTVHFARLIDYMRQDAIRRHCFDTVVDSPEPCMGE